MIETFYQDILDRHLPGEKVMAFSSVGGGCINQAVKLQTSSGLHFLKWNAQFLLDLCTKNVLNGLPIQQIAW